MNDGKSALAIRLIIGITIMAVIAISMASVPLVAMLVVLPMSSVPVILYVLLFRTTLWSVVVGVALLATWLVMRLVPLSDDGLHGLWWFTVVPVAVAIAGGLERSRVRQPGD